MSEPKVIFNRPPCPMWGYQDKQKHYRIVQGQIPGLGSLCYVEVKKGEEWELASPQGDIYLEILENFVDTIADSIDTPIDCTHWGL